jgi:hypothetical protein
MQRHLLADQRRLARWFADLDRRAEPDRRAGGASTLSTNRLASLTALAVPDRPRRVSAGSHFDEVTRTGWIPDRENLVNRSC